MVRLAGTPYTLYADIFRVSLAIIVLTATAELPADAFGPAAPALTVLSPTDWPDSSFY